MPRWASGCHPSFEAAVAAMTRVAETREPDPANHALYEDLYRSVYLPLYAGCARCTRRSGGSPGIRRRSEGPRRRRGTIDNVPHEAP